MARILLDGSRLHNVGPSPALSPSKKGQLDSEEGGSVGKVLDLAGGEPGWHIKDANLGQNVGDEDSGGSKHGPSSVLEFGLDEPLQEFGVGSCKRLVMQEC